MKSEKPTVAGYLVVLALGLALGLGIAGGPKAVGANADDARVVSFAVTGAAAREQQALWRLWSDGTIERAFVSVVSTSPWMKVSTPGPLVPRAAE